MKQLRSSVLTSFRAIYCLTLFCFLTAGSSPFDHFVTNSSRMCAKSSYLLDDQHKKSVCASKSTEFLFEILKTCDWNPTVLIGEDNFIQRFQEQLLFQFQSNKYSIVHLNNFSQDAGISQGMIRKFYVEDKIRNFILILKNSLSFLSNFYGAFAAEARGMCALMPHRVRLVVIQLESHHKFIVEQLKTCVFDNVVIVEVGEKTMDVDGIYTLMWRRNRTRELEAIKIFQWFPKAMKEKTCELFPNVKFGLNRRRLIILAKEWLLHLYKEPLPVSAETKYVGFYMDVIRLLAESLNFTMTLVPKPGEDDNMSWDDFSRQIGSSSVDLGATTYPISTSAYYNHTVSFPLLCGNISGIYINQESQSIYFPMIFKNDLIYVIFIFAVVINVIIYSITTRAFIFLNQTVATCAHNESPTNRNSSENKSIREFVTGTGGNDRESHCDTGTCNINARNQNILSIKVPSPVTLKEPLLILKRRDNGETAVGLLLQALFSDLRGVQIYEYFLDVTFKFIGTIFNQNTFEIPGGNSARILLWFWNMMVLVMSATFTGTIIANLVDKGDTLPFTTFEEMMARGDYKWSCESESSAMRLMQGAPKGSTMQKLYVGVERYAHEHPDFNGTMPEIIDRLKRDKFVAVVTGAWQENVRARYLLNLQTIKENLLVTCSGLVLPVTSELERDISQKLLVMTDTGLLDHAMKSIRNKTRGAGRATDEDQAFDYKFMEPVMYLCGYLIGSALLLLILECLCANVNLQSCKSQR